MSSPIAFRRQKKSTWISGCPPLGVFIAPRLPSVSYWALWWDLGCCWICSSYWPDWLGNGHSREGSGATERALQREADECQALQELPSLKNYLIYFNICSFLFMCQRTKKAQSVWLLITWMPRDGLDEAEATQLAFCKNSPVWLQLHPFQPCPAQWSTHTPPHTHSSVSGSPLQRKLLWLSWSWGSSPRPGLTRSELVLDIQLDGGSRTPAARGARGWGWGFGSAAWQGWPPDMGGPGHKNAFHVERQSGSADGHAVQHCVGPVARGRARLWRCYVAMLLETSGQKKCWCPGGPSTGLRQTTPCYSHLCLKGRHMVMPQESTPLLATLWRSYCWQDSHTPCRLPELWSLDWAPGSENSESRLTEWSQSWD